MNFVMCPRRDVMQIVAESLFNIKFTTNVNMFVWPFPLDTIAVE